MGDTKESWEIVVYSYIIYNLLEYTYRKQIIIYLY